MATRSFLHSILPTTTTTVLLTLFLLASFVTLATAQSEAASAANTSPPHEIVCGTKFTDPASSALQADIVLQGTVSAAFRLPATPQGAAVSGRQRGVEVTVGKVYKGRELLLHSPGTRQSAGRNPNDSSARFDPGLVVEVEGVGEEEDRERCVARMSAGDTRLFFLRVAGGGGGVHGGGAGIVEVSSASSSSSAGGPEEDVGEGAEAASRRLVISALPRDVDVKTLRQVKKVLCPGCQAVPVIRRVRCKRCAEAPSMKRQMTSHPAGAKTLRAGRRLTLRCAARGSPRPVFTWLKDGRVIHHGGEEEVEVGEGEGGSPPAAGRSGRRRSGSDGGAPNVFRSGSLMIRDARQFSLLVVKKVTPEDQGIYLCIATNAVGKVEESVQVVVEGGERSRPSTTPSPSPSEGDPDPDLDSVASLTPDPCAIGPCYNGGTCERDPENVRRALCQCPPDYHGRSCQFTRRRPVAEDDADVDDENDVDIDDDKDDDDGDVDGIDPETNKKNLSVGTPGQSSTASNSHNATDRVSATQTAVFNNTNSDDNLAATTTITTNNDLPAISTTGVTADNSRVPNNIPKTSITKKLRRKYGKSDRGQHGANRKPSKSGSHQLKATECQDDDYCQNGGTCSVVVELKLRFCKCPVGFAGRQCERRV